MYSDYPNQSGLMKPAHNQPPPSPDPNLDTVLELLESHGGDFWTVATGDSMMPLIREGDRLLVQPAQSPLRRGEIMVFRSESRLIAHRLLRLRRNPQSESVYLAQGDHALSPDPPISFNQV